MISRVDEIVTTPGWNYMHDVAAEEGLVAIGYQRKTGEYSRVHQFVKLLLFGASSGLYNCPLAMTDGAARLLEVRKSFNGQGNFKGTPENVNMLADEAYKHLTSRDAIDFWTSGQWVSCGH